MRTLKRQWLRLLTHIAALLPLLVLVWDFSQGQLTANPIQEIQLRTGRYALTLLILSLACTPLNIVFGIRQILQLRPLLGLYAFVYACLHLLNFFGLDYGFNFPLVWEDFAEKRFIVAGLAAFLSLLPLAVTSTAGWVRRLGKNWGRLHWLAYSAGALAIVHFLWQVKADFTRPLIYGIVLALLLIIRLPNVRRAIGEFRQRLSKG
ncbi:MAG: protein-methionine-sulfoxide reductase heme-binding subunit MsrQ [Dehalococcoidales bacterium]|nr:protein-methionine-sulfoxide reductase heme-binding subunit MsrQ [Dehalococcoidales bacterium]